MKKSNIKFIVVDLFCGAGGTSTGFASAKVNGKKIAKVIACVNHDPIAIKSHWENYKNVRHFEEDIRTLDLTELVKIVQAARKKYPNAKLILWASLECTNFSKAKGGQARLADSRTLAQSLHMKYDPHYINEDGTFGQYIDGDSYIQLLNPDYIMIENVVEFMSWGPLDENGKPISKKSGEDYVKWVNSIKSIGYYDKWEEMNSANFGAFTSRNRIFGCFGKPGMPIVFPVPTHAKKPKNELFSTPLKKWRSVKDVLDFTDEGKSIFNRNIPLVEASLERIYAGLVKFVAGGDKAFLSKYYSGGPSSKVSSIDTPAGTITTSDHHSLILPISMLKYNSKSKKGVYIPPSLEDPCPTISCQNRLGYISGEFLSAYYSTGDNVSSTDSPCPTIPTKDRFQLVMPKKFIGMTSQVQSINAPSGSIMTSDKHTLVVTQPFILNPSHGGHCTDTKDPCPVIVARQDKAPLYVITAVYGSTDVHIPIYDTDSSTMVKIKEFMAIYGLIDIKMRMLKVKELLRIQGFPDGYILMGNQTDQKKFIGNSVVPLVVKVWIECLYNYLNTEYEMDLAA